MGGSRREGQRPRGLALGHDMSCPYRRTDLKVGHYRRRNRGVGVGEGGVGEAEAEGDERLFGQVTVGAVGHGVVGVRRKLGDGFVERDGETSGGIVVTGENVGDGGATFFAGIPSFEDSGSVFVGPIDGEGAAIGENGDERLAGGGEGYKKFLLGARKREIGAITAKEAGVAVFGFFAFELCGDADDGDDDVGFAGGGDGFLEKIRREPDKAHGGFPGVVKIFQLDRVGVAGLEMDQCGEGAFTVRGPIIDEDFVVEVEAAAAIGADTETIVAINGRDEKAAPACGEIFGGDTGGRRDIVPFEIDGIDASKGGGAGESSVGEEFGSQARDRYMGTGYVVAILNVAGSIRKEGGGGDGDGAGFGDRRANSGGNFGVGETLANAGEDGGVRRGSAVVIAEERIEGVGGGADDGDGFDGGFERKGVALVFEKDDGFARGVESELAVGRSVDVGKREMRPWHTIGRIEHAKAEAGFEETADGAVDIVGRDEAIVGGAIEGFELWAAGEVGASSERERGGLIERDDEAVALVEIVDGPTIGDHVAAETPLVAKEIEEQVIGAGGFAADGVVSTHDGVGVAIDDGGAEGGSVSVV